MDPKSRERILHVSMTAKLMKHKIANAVVELYYNDHTNALRRNRMLQDFCVPEFTKFKDNEIRTVMDLIKKYPEKERDIYKNLHENVCVLISHKGLLQSQSCSHRNLQFFNYCQGKGTL